MFADKMGRVGTDGEVKSIERREWDKRQSEGDTQRWEAAGERKEIPDQGLGRLGGRREKGRHRWKKSMRRKGNRF